MQEFIFIFRFTVPKEMPDATAIAKQRDRWQHWIGAIASQSKLISTQRLGFEGKLHLVDTSEAINFSVPVVSGIMHVRCEDTKDAQKIAQGCPVFDLGGSVEIRPVIPMS